MRALVVTGAIVLMAASCSGSSGDQDDAGAARVAADEDGSAAARATSDAASGAAASGSGSGGSIEEADAALISVAAGEARVVRVASLQVAVPEGEFGVAFAAASQVATTLGGFVQSSSTSSYEVGRASGEVTLRVPVARFDDAVDQLGALGDVESTRVEGDDVSGELVDLAARLRSMRAEEEALNALLLEAENVGEILTVRQTLAGVRQAIEQLAAQEASLSDRAAHSTVSVVLHEGPDAAAAASSPDDGWTLGDALEMAVRGATSVIGGAIVAVGFALPLLPLALIAWYLVRRRRAVVPTA